jgi:hypothetical protein
MTIASGAGALAIGPFVAVGGTLAGAYSNPTVQDAIGRLHTLARSP